MRANQHHQPAGSAQKRVVEKLIMDIVVSDLRTFSSRRWTPP